MNPGAVLFPTMYEMLIGMLKSWKYRCFIDNRLNGWRRRRRRRKARVRSAPFGSDNDFLFNINGHLSSQLVVGHRADLNMPVMITCIASKLRDWLGTAMYDHSPIGESLSLLHGSWKKRKKANPETDGLDLKCVLQVASSIPGANILWSQYGEWQVTAMRPAALLIWDPGQVCVCVCVCDVHLYLYSRLFSDVCFFLFNLTSHLHCESHAWTWTHYLVWEAWQSNNNC